MSVKCERPVGWQAEQGAMSNTVGTGGSVTNGIAPVAGREVTDSGGAFATGSAADMLAQIASEILSENCVATYVTRHLEEADALAEIGFDAIHIDNPALGVCLPQGPNSHCVLCNVPRLPADLSKFVEKVDVLLLPPHWRNVCEFLEWRPGSRPAEAEVPKLRARWLEFVGNQQRLLVARQNVPTRERLRFLRPWELAALPSRSWLWDGIIGEGDLAMLFGPWGTYKSFLAVGLAVAIADGTQFLGRDVERGLVLLVCGEGGAGIANRLKAATAVSRINDRHDPIHQGLGVANSMPALTEPAGFDGTCRAIEAMGTLPRLLIIDTTARAAAAAGLDENSTGDMGLLVAALDRLRARFPGCAVLAVHHSGNDRNDRSRGSSALPSACDTILRVEPVRGPGAPQVKLTVEKLKDGRKPLPLLVDFAETTVGEAKGNLITSMRVASFYEDAGKDNHAADPAAEVVKLHMELRAKGPLPSAALWQLLGTGKSAGIARLKKLVGQGHLVCTPAPHRGLPDLYDLPGSLK